MFTISRDIYNFNSNTIHAIENDALTFLESAKGLYDLIVVDLFLGENVTPVICSLQFAYGVKRVLAPQGNLIINIYKEPLRGPLGVFLREQFPELGVFTSASNTLLVTQTRPIPDDFYDQFQSSLFRRIQARDNQKLITFKKSNALRAISLGGVGVLMTHFTDDEPDSTTINASGLRHGIVIWTPWKKRFKPAGWGESLFPLRAGGKGFTKIIKEYRKKWSQTARRDLKIFETSGAHIEVCNKEDFLLWLNKSTTGKWVREATRLTLKRMRDEKVTYWVAKKDDVVLGALAVLDYDAISYHLVCYITREGVPFSAGTGLVDTWFRYAVNNNITYLDWGHIYQRGEPKDWIGFTIFKRKFIDQELQIPRSFIKWF